MDHYNFQPQLRPSPANMLTRSGWIRGTFRIPPHQSLIDFLSTSVNVVKFTTVSLPNQGGEFSFVGMRPEAIMLIEPTLGDELIILPGAGHITSPRAATCLLPTGTLTGTVDVLVNVRISDFLRTAPQFMVMRDATYTPDGEAAASPQVRKMRTVLVHVPTISGVAEREGHGNT